MAEGSSDAIQQNRSSLREFIASIATMTGDLTNITAPPFVLDVKSTVEIPSYWAENPSVFCAPATAEDPAERALLALKTFLSGLRSQCYMGHSEKEGLKKPLNAFLGELFIARWEDESNGTTQVVSEQVSHHPPVTACRIWNDKYGVTAESYNQPIITFTGSVHIDSAGLVLKSISKYNEHYLVPIPDFKVTGILTTPSPELTGTYYIPSTSGYMSVIHFQEKGFFGSNSKKHSFEAHVFKEAEGEKNPIYSLKGSWFDEFSIYDNLQSKDVGTVNIKSDVIDKAPKMQVQPMEKQDPWETRNAWQEVQAALLRGDMKTVTEAKNKLEEGQRQMRKDEEASGKKWSPLFFEPRERSELIESLVARIPTGTDAKKSINQSGTGWTMNMKKWEERKRPPYHGDLRPDNATQAQTSQTPGSPQQQPQSATANAATAAGTTSQTHVQDPALAQSPYRTEGQPKHQFSTSHDDGTMIDHRLGALESHPQAPPSPSASIQSPSSPSTAANTSTIDGTPIDIGRSPEKKHIEGITKDEPGPQANQVASKEAYEGSGIEGMTLQEKQDVEDMLRDKYSSAGDAKKDSQRKTKKQDS